jgi:DNA-binding beta-propeller fold protein YncE
VLRFATLTLGVLGLAVAAGSACGSHGVATVTVEAGLGPLEASPPPLVSPGAQVDATSSPVVFDTLRGGVWTANGDVGTVSYVDVDAFKVVVEIPVGASPGADVRSVALSPDQAWIAAVDRAAGTVTLVDAYTNVVARTIAVGNHPRAAVWSASNPRWLYVALEGGDAIAIVDRTMGVLAQTLPVGRMPSGLAVSRKRNELYVTHRIDPKISIVDLASGALLDDIPLAVQPAKSDPTVPQGTPFAFEGMSWQPMPDMMLHDQGGDVLWVPHELFAPTHPFQFQTTVFPAISVVDVAQRAEVVTTPDTNQTNGRKLLFDAINIPDLQGNPSIISQPCAIAQHPNAIAVYALACGSDDLLTFDATQGIAVNLIRDLPGDHPVGITLDDTGTRAFVVSDQSHTLLAYDIAGGQVMADLRLLNGQHPVPLVAKDPIDPQLRAGQTLFFSANGLAKERGNLAITGNNWLSCGACHLDGFGGAEEVLFEDAHLRDPTRDAQIGHFGLVDLFSTAPTPASATFDPHDIVVAMLEQGGLAPDRTGQSRAGAVDPSHPSAAAVTMATLLAYVVARDLPLGPTWLSSTGPPNAANDGAFCGQCHSREYAAWQQSAHAHAGADPMMKYCRDVEQGLAGQSFTRLCVGCHDPIGARTGDTTLSTGRGVTCLSCHEVTLPIRAGGNAALVATPYDWTVSHKDRAQADLATLRQPEFCGGCHSQFVPGTGLSGIDTLAAWKASRFAGSAATFPDGGLPDEDAGIIPGDDAGADSGATYCVTCHMPSAGGLADHRFIGGNVYLSSALGDGGTVADLTANLARAMTVRAVKSGSGYLVTVSNVGAGHDFPNGVPDLRESWVEVDALDASRNVLLRIGGPDPTTNLIPASAARFGYDLAGADGGLLLRHELSLAASIPFDRRVPSGGSVDVFVPAPKSMPAGTVELDAVLYVRSVRTTFYRAATGSPTATAPEVLVARAVIP